MTKEELEKEYYVNRPIEPYSEDASPNSWASIAYYAEENLDKAFQTIVELEKENTSLKENNELLARLNSEQSEAIRELRLQIEEMESNT